MFVKLCFWPLPCLLRLQEQRLRYLKQQEQRQQQQASEQEKLQRLRENIENQEARLKKVRALKGQVEQKRLSNGKLGELKYLRNSWIDACSEYCMAASMEVLISVIKTQSLSLSSCPYDIFSLHLFISLLCFHYRHTSSLCLLFPLSPPPIHLHLSSFPVEEIEQMNNLFQQKQRELVMAASKVEELSRQLELLKNGKMDNFNDNQSSVAELDRLYKELQVCRNKILNEKTLKQNCALKKVFVFNEQIFWTFLCPYVFFLLMVSWGTDSTRIKTLSCSSRERTWTSATWRWLPWTNGSMSSETDCGRRRQHCSRKKTCL